MENLLPSELFIYLPPGLASSLCKLSVRPIPPPFLEKKTKCCCRALGSRMNALLLLLLLLPLRVAAPPALTVEEPRGSLASPASVEVLTTRTARARLFPGQEGAEIWPPTAKGALPSKVLSSDVLERPAGSCRPAPGDPSKDFATPKPTDTSSTSQLPGRQRVEPRHEAGS